MKIREVYKRLSKKVWGRNPEFSTRREAIKIGLCQILDGFIAVFSNGRLIGSFSSGEISKAIASGIERRKKRRLVIGCGSNN